MSIPRYSRVLLKLSGEILAGEKGFGIDPDVTSFLAGQVKYLHDAGLELGIVIGAGNIFRGISASANGIDRVTGDYLGMTATILNSVALQSALINLGCQARVMSALSIEQLAEPYIRERALDHLQKGRILIFAGGTGNPYFTTDTAAALRAAEVKAQVVLKGTRVDGVYDSDPEKNPQAHKFDFLTYQEVIERELKVMDLTAVTLCMENNLPIVVTNVNDSSNLQKFVAGQDVGTLISKEITK